MIICTFNEHNVICKPCRFFVLKLKEIQTVAIAACRLCAIEYNPNSVCIDIEKKSRLYTTESNGAFIIV